MSKSLHDDAQLLRTWIRECPANGMVFFGGAGVSTESGIPDFRSADGIYSQHYRYPPEYLVSHSCFTDHPQEFFAFYFEHMVPRDAQPNPAHIKLAHLENEGILKAVITQNIDGLHQKAGSKKVWELHGSIHRNFCTACHRAYTLEKMLSLHATCPSGIPLCTCGHIIKPDVVLYEEALDDTVLRASIDAITCADLLIVAGTSLTVYPASGLLHYFHGKHLAIVNLAPTNADRFADLCIAAKIGELFSF